MKLQVLLEAVKFSEFLESQREELTRHIKSPVQVAQSVHEEYNFDTHNYDRVNQIVNGVKLSVILHTELFCSFTDNKKDVKDYYCLSNLVVCSKSVCSDGYVARLIWDFLEPRIDLSEYPHFHPPQFSGDKQVMGNPGEFNSTLKSMNS